MGPRIYPSYQDTNTTSKGSLIINYLDIFPNAYNDYIQITVNGVLRDRTYNKVNGLYKTNLNIGDIVLIELTSDIILFKNITVYRRDYTTDDQSGDFGIVDSFITYNNNDTTTISLTFTATTLNDSYNFEYKVSGNVGTNPTTDCQINGLSFDNDGAYVLARSFGYLPLQLSLTAGSVNSFNYITDNLNGLRGATINFNGEIINYVADGLGYTHEPNYSLNGGKTFTTSSISFDSSLIFSDMDCTIDGTYQVVGQVSGSLYVSSNSGQTYNAVSNSIKYWTKPVIPYNTAFPFYAITSTLGDYIYKINSLSGYTQLSSAAKAPTYSNPTGYTPSTGTTYFTSFAMSQDTKYVVAAYNFLPFILNDKNSSIMLSSDSGTTFNFINVGITMSYPKVAMSNSGQYIYIVTETSNISSAGGYAYSNNYGSTWTTITNQNAGIYISCSGTGKYVYKGTYRSLTDSNIGALFISSDYGVTFNGDELYGITNSDYAKPNKN
jgi:hypothetical protein